LAGPPPGARRHICAIQFTPVDHQPELNRERLTKLINEARQRGARYVVTPELAPSAANAKAMAAQQS
jgi:predicted amidohydrolase